MRVGSQGAPAAARPAAAGRNRTGQMRYAVKRGVSGLVKRAGGSPGGGGGVEPRLTRPGLVKRGGRHI